MLSEAIILAGGFGTRLKNVIADVPKPMAPVNQVPFLSYLLKYLSHYGIKRVVISTGHLAENISNFYNAEFLGIELVYSHEETPLGTGGGIRLALEKCHTKNVLVLNGDSFFDIDLLDFYKKHNANQSSCSLALRAVEDAARYGTIELEQNLKIKSFKEKDGHAVSGTINAGIYLLDKSVFLHHTKSSIPFSIEKDFFEKQLTEITLFGFIYSGYFIDIGIPADYTKAQHDFTTFAY